MALTCGDPWSTSICSHFIDKDNIMLHSLTSLPFVFVHHGGAPPWRFLRSVGTVGYLHTASKRIFSTS